MDLLLLESAVLVFDLQAKHCVVPQLLRPTGKQQMVCSGPSLLHASVPF